MVEMEKLLELILPTVCNNKNDDITTVNRSQNDFIINMLKENEKKQEEDGEERHRERTSEENDTLNEAFNVNFKGFANVIKMEKIARPKIHSCTIW